MSIAAKSRENCRAALVPNRCTGEEGRRGIGWLACPRGWMISNERIFFYYLGGDVIGYVWYVANGNLVVEGNFLNIFLMERTC